MGILCKSVAGVPVGGGRWNGNEYSQWKAVKVEEERGTKTGLGRAAEQRLAS